MKSSVRSNEARRLNGARLLVVEDDFLLLTELEEVLCNAGAEVVEGCRTLADALALAKADGFAAAVLDVRIGHDSIVPVARQLAAREVPFVFYTGQVANDRMMAEWPACRILSKPAQPTVIVAAVAQMLRQ